MLLKLARSPLGRWCMGWIMEYWSSVLPVDRLFETDRLIAFRHPQPVYEVHILIVPKKAVSDLAGLLTQEDEFVSQLMSDMLRCVSRLVAELELEKSGYRLIVNGGVYQEIPELHFHLISGLVTAASGT